MRFIGLVLPLVLGCQDYNSRRALIRVPVALARKSVNAWTKAQSIADGFPESFNGILFKAINTLKLSLDDRPRLLRTIEYEPIPP